tara:strand:+ start:577 stop:891 length:315 start_codon:yes stop_codon:yes gene_type:complete
MDDEGRWDKDQQHLDDYHYDLRHEEELANCECNDYTITAINDISGYSRKGHKVQEPIVEVELTCDFCGKSNYGEIPLEQVLDLLNNFLFDYRITCIIQDDYAWE